MSPHVESLIEGVSRETLSKLELYESLVLKWNPSINLISKNSAGDVWDRHFRDSLQLLDFVNSPDGIWMDLGSGAGFPGAVCAIVAAELNPALSFVLVESDARKCVFLQTIARETGMSFRVENQRVESLEPLNCAVVSARALAPLPKLLSLSFPHVSRETICLFPKGKNYQQELEHSLDNWRFQVQKHQSKTSAEATILEIRELERAS
jgi:16S rRNA (guanine527-N7)-methyltransferase